VSDLPLDLGGALSARLGDALDVEAKIPRALETLGPVAERDVLLLDGAGGLRAGQLEGLGARVTVTSAPGPVPFEADDASADVIVGCWSTFRAAPEDEIADARRILRPGGRLLVVHDYGRDDVARLLGDRPEYAAWTRRDGPFLGHGFKIRVIHCFWTFPSIDEMRDFLDAAFGEQGRDVAASLHRPRLSYNIAVYHRTMEAAA
jgi:SAM-dependent methyltransferase